MNHLPTVEQLAREKPHLCPVVTLQAGNGARRVLAGLQPKQMEAFRLTPLMRPKGASGPVYIGYGGSAGGGKALSLATTIPTATGWTTFGDVAVDDEVFDEAGRLCRVVVVGPIHQRPCYRLTCDDGSYVVAADEHEWMTCNAAERGARRTPVWRAARRPIRVAGNRSETQSVAILVRNRRPPPRCTAAPSGAIRTTRQIAASLRTPQGRRNHAIPVTAPLALPPLALSLNPYLLGVWLGNGTSRAGQITTADQAIVESFAAAGFTVRRSGRYRYGILGLKALLRRIGVLDNKHIPPAYLRASAEQRLALLQGLMDTDGYAAESGSVEFTTTSPALRDGMADLLASMGWKSRMVEGRATLNGRDCGPKWRVHWTPSLPVFRLARKLARQRLATRRTTQYRYIVTCEPLGPMPVRCIEVDSPSHLFLAGRAMIPTHNSLFARVAALAVAFSWPGSRGLLIRETDDDIKKNHFQPLRALLGWMPGLKWNETDLTCMLPNRSVIECGYLKQEKDWARYQGNEYQLIVFEEATLLPWNAVQLVMSRLRGGPSQAVPFALFPSNPGGPSHQHFKRWFVQRRFREDERPEDYAFVQARLDDNTELQRSDPSYARKLDLLPEPYRSWQRDGDFSAGAGSALQVDWRRHLVPPFAVPPHWVEFGAYDWGYRHPFCFGWYAVSEDGDVFKVDGVTGTRLQVHEQIDRIRGRVPVHRLSYIHAGHDVKADRRAWGENTPTVQQQFSDAGIILSLANIDRRQGLANFRRMLDWTASGPIIDGRVTEGDPQLRFMDTPDNRACLEQLEAMVDDPKSNREDVLKVDADDFGMGGDDWYDECRYALASRPAKGRTTWQDKTVGAFAPEVLQYEAEQQRRDRDKDPREQRTRVIPDAVW